eukprot:TRINITY_DN893_c0_g1_i1.p3 TRINITY_DN893_c0_g1~~TRINITY_DN893_c0_g1_i1.p3  ORF type:complete len:63 (+),score=6.63 TRINITY_DN893_c0_g1_i1:539-727(+)
MRSPSNRRMKSPPRPSTRRTKSQPQNTSNSSSSGVDTPLIAQMKKEIRELLQSLPDKCHVRF